MKASKDILGEKLYTQVKERLGDKKIIIEDENYIPRSRLNHVIHEKNVLRKNMETLNKELEELQEDMKFKAQHIKRLKDSQDKLVQENTKIKDICFASSIKLEALKMNAKNIHVVSNLIDKSKLEILEDGGVKGIEDQLNELKETQKILFGEDILISLMDVQHLVGEMIQRRLMENL
jgi:cell division protein FtsB